MTKPLVSGAKQIVQKLLEHGYEAYMVGGCVRDMQLNRPVKDYDIATSAKPEQLQRLFERTIPTGLQHGTISIIADGHVYEVTTYRKESGYEDFRRPSEVEYIDSLYEDLQRRDFTMNAMAMDLDGRLIDPFHGVSDLAGKLLRCVGDAEQRFREDALRILRCIRFAAEYGLDVEDQTWQALLTRAPLLSHIAMERVRMELERMIQGADPARAVELLIRSRVLAYAKQPLKLAGLRRDMITGDWVCLIEPEAKWAYLYLLLQLSPAEIERELRLLTFPKQHVAQVRRIAAAAYELADRFGAVIAVESDVSLLEERCKLAAVEHGIPAMNALVGIAQLAPASLTALGISGQVCGKIAERGSMWLSDLPVHSVEQLDINGKELLTRFGKPGGPWVAKLLKHILYETALKRLANEKHALLAEAERYADQSDGAGKR